MSISAPRVILWECPVPEHAEVRFEGSIACCEECPLTSELTEAVLARGRAEQRRLDIEWFRDLAQQARKAREAPNGSWSVCQLESALPASILERVAALLEEYPLGQTEI